MFSEQSRMIATVVSAEIPRPSAYKKDVAASDGFLLFDAALKPLLISTGAARILAYPQKPEEHSHLDGHLAKRIRTTLIADGPTRVSALVARFQSGRRTYSCRSFAVTSMTNGHSQAAVAVLLERVSLKAAMPTNIFLRFNLTAREQEVAQLLLQGLTSKEIGKRMQISPNTVKAFLRLIMVKMNVSTRSGIVGKALRPE